MFSAISGNSFRRERARWSSDWGDLKFIVSVGFRLLFDDYLSCFEIFTTLLLLVFLIFWRFQTVARTGRRLIMLEQSKLSTSSYVDEFMVKINVSATRSLPLDWSQTKKQKQQLEMARTPSQYSLLASAIVKHPVEQERSWFDWMFHDSQEKIDLSTIQNRTFCTIWNPSARHSCLLQSIITFHAWGFSSPNSRDFAGALRPGLGDSNKI